MSPTIALLGLVFLFFGGELLEKGSVGLAFKMRISTSCRVVFLTN